MPPRRDSRYAGGARRGTADPARARRVSRGAPEDLPGFVRSAFVADHETRVVDEAINRIASDYYRPVAKSGLTNGSIAGAVATLNDRFSHYLSPREYREFNSPPSFTGIGVSVAPVSRGLRIARVFDGTPAARCGAADRRRDRGVNGRQLAGLSADAAIAPVKGPPGTDVKLGVELHRARSTRSPKTLTLTRAIISEPVVETATKTADGIKLGVVASGHVQPQALMEKCAKASNTCCTPERAASCSTCEPTAAGWSRRPG